MKARHAEIAGAGFAGLAMALALARRSWSVRLHERSSSLRAFGAGIFIWENGLRVLRALGIHDEVTSRCNIALKYLVFDPSGRLIHEQAFGAPMGTRMAVMTRATLHDALLQAALSAEVEIVTGSEIARATEDGGLVDTAGRRFFADLAIGADGIGSRVRESLGLIRSRTKLVHGAIRTLVHADFEGPEGVGPLDVASYLSSSGRRLLCAPCAGGDVYLAFLSRGAADADRRVPLDLEHWAAAFPQKASLIGHAGAEGRWDSYESIDVHKWSSGRVALLGDASHAMPPTLGQGAGLALTNALALAVFLDQYVHVTDALRHWEAEVRPLTDYTQHRSEELLAQPDRFRDPSAGVWSDESMRAARHVPIGSSP